MDEHNEHGQVDTNLGISRRTVLRRGAVVGGSLVWAAPAVQSISRSALAATNGTPPVGDCICTGTSSFDVTAGLSGLINANVGPIQNFPEDNDCLANVSVTATGLLGALATVGVDCVGGTTTGGTCSSFVELTDLHTDLSTILPALNVQLDASVVRAEATCTCDGGCQAQACITQAAGEAIVTIGGVVVLAGTGVAICGRQEIAINIATLLGTVTGTIVLNDTSTDPCQATVATITAQVRDLAGLVTQTVNIVIARATAVCTQG